jgi:hypothetical protein
MSATLSPFLSQYTDLQRLLRTFDFQNNTPEETARRMNMDVAILIGERRYDDLADWMRMVHQAHVDRKDSTRFTWFIRVFQEILKDNVFRHRDWKTKENEAMDWVARGFSQASETAEKIALGAAYYRAAHAVRKSKSNPTLKTFLAQFTPYFEKGPHSHCLASFLAYCEAHPDFEYGNQQLQFHLLKALAPHLNEKLATPQSLLFEHVLGRWVARCAHHPVLAIKFVEEVYDLLIPLTLTHDVHPLRTILQQLKAHLQPPYFDSLFQSDVLSKQLRRMFHKYKFKGWLIPKSFSAPSIFSALPLSHIQSLSEFCLSVARKEAFDAVQALFPHDRVEIKPVLDAVLSRMPLAYNKHEFSFPGHSPTSEQYLLLNDRLAHLTPLLERLALRQTCHIEASPEHTRRTSAL